MALTKVKASNITLTTAAAGSNDTTPATTQYVTTAINNLIDGAPATLNTLDEIAAALNDDAALNTTLTNAIAAKAPLAGPTFTGDVDIDGNDDLRLRFLSGSTFKGGIQVPTSTGDMISGAAVDDLAIRSQANMLFSSGGNTERMRIRPDGTTTIGRAITPTYDNDQGYPLHIQAATGSQTYLSISVPGAASGDTGVVMGHDGTGTRITNREADPMIFGISSSEKMRIAGATGNVGIGTGGDPSTWAKLEVAGTAGAQTGATQALYVRAPTATANQGVGIRMSAASGSHEAVGIIGMVNNASGNAGSMTFHTYNLGATIPEVMRITNTGNVGIGNSAPNTKLYVEGPQNDIYGQLYIKGGSAANQDPQISMGSSQNGRGFYIDDSAVNRFKIYTGHGKGASSGAYEFVLDNSGTIESKRTYNNTTGSYSANVYVHTDGSFNRATSSRRYKKDIVDADKGLDEILQLKPRNYKPENNRTDSSEVNAEVNDPHLDAAERTFAGLIAEEVHDLGLTEYVDYEEDGTTPSGLYYGNMVALLVKGIQEQQTIINDLKARIETLEG